MIGANIVITAFCSITARLGMTMMEPIPFAIITLFISLLALAMPLIRSGRLPLLWGKKHVLPLMALGFFGTSITSLLLFYAGKTVPASRIVILGQIEILFSMALGVLFLKERIGFKQIAATTLILSGMLLALKAGNFDSFGRGEMMILCMPLCFQFSHLISKKILPELGTDVVSVGRTAYGILFLIPLIPFFAPAADWINCLNNPRAVTLLIFQGLIINALSIWLWYAALKRTDLSKITTLILTYPLLTLMIAKWLPGFNEQVSGGQFLGAFLVIIGGSFLSQIPSMEPPSDPAGVALFVKKPIQI